MNIPPEIRRDSLCAKGLFTKCEFCYKINIRNMIRKRKCMLSRFLLAVFSLCFLFSNIYASAVSVRTDAKISPEEGPISGDNETIITSEDGFFVNKKIIQTAGGAAHSLALDDDGEVYSWGNNTYGQLGDGSNVSVNLPVNISQTSDTLKDKKIVQIAAGFYHSLAIDSKGNLYTWGRNNSGQLGNGTNINSNEPVYIPTDFSVDKVTSRADHSVAIDSSGLMYSWGTNNANLLGHSNGANRKPEKVSEGMMANVKAVSVSTGNNHSLVLGSDKRIYAWGSNASGQLGLGYSTNVPSLISTLSNVKTISAGGGHSFAMTEDNKIYSWGYNDNGQLGNGTYSSAGLPTEVTYNFVGLDETATAAGSGYSSVLNIRGKIYTWGWNIYGQLGSGVTSTNNPLPGEVYAGGVLLDKEIVSISGGQYHSLVIDSSGRVYSWGRNDNGQLGSGDKTSSNVPVEVDFGSLLDREITSVKFDNNEALSFSVIDEKTIRAVVPPHAAGKVDVRIIDNKGNSWIITLGYEYIEEIIPAPDSEFPPEIETPNTGVGKIVSK